MKDSTKAKKSKSPVGEAPPPVQDIEEISEKAAKLVIDTPIKVNKEPIKSKEPVVKKEPSKPRKKKVLKEPPPVIEDSEYIPEIPTRVIYTEDDSPDTNQFLKQVEIKYKDYGIQLKVIVFDDPLTAKFENVHGLQYVEVVHEPIRDLPHGTILFKERKFSDYI